MRRLLQTCAVLVPLAVAGCGDAHSPGASDAGSGLDAARSDASGADGGVSRDGAVPTGDGGVGSDGGGADGAVPRDGGVPADAGTDAGLMCGGRGSGCGPAASCCAPLVCNPGEPARCGDPCAGVGASCAGTACCAGLTCSMTPFGPGVCTEVTCGTSGAGCFSATDCCAGLLCSGGPRGGTCAPADCRLRSDVCDATHPCCPGGVCTPMGMLSFCVDDAGMCSPSFSACGPGLPGCCAGSTCLSDPFGGATCQPDGTCGDVGADCIFAPCCPGLSCATDPTGRTSCVVGGGCPPGAFCDPAAPCCDRGLSCVPDASGTFTCSGGGMCAPAGEICVSLPCCPGLSCIPRGPTEVCAAIFPPPPPA